MGNIQDIYDRYLAEGGESQALDFGIWLIRTNPALMKEEQPTKPGFTDIPDDTLTAILLARLERFVHLETKQALKKVGINNPDEFALMSTLNFMGKTTKTILLRQCLFELTTGSHMLKRLYKDGYVIEKVNQEDRRSSFIELSAKGRKKLYEAFAQLNSIKGLTDGFTQEQKDLLLKSLHQLDRTHSARLHIDTVESVVSQH